MPRTLNIEKQSARRTLNTEKQSARRTPNAKHIEVECQKREA
jgi:hypothetical protein